MNNKAIAKIDFKIVLELNEMQARALDAIVGYGIDPFLKVFYQHLGQHYLKPHEPGAKDLFKHVKTTISQQLYHVDNAKTELSKVNSVQFVNPA